MKSKQVYRASISWKITFSIAMPLLIVLLAWIMLFPFRDERLSGTGMALYYFLVCGGCILSILYALLSVFKGRIEVYPDRIRKVCLFHTRELLLSDIKGFKIIPPSYTPKIHLIPNTPNAKKIKTVLIIERKEDFLDWLDQNLDNLTGNEYLKSMGELYHNEELGATRLERTRFLERARGCAYNLNLLSFFSIIFLFVKPWPYRPVMLTIVIFPFIVLFFARRYKGVIQFHGDFKRFYPDASLAFFMPPMVLLGRLIYDVNILNWDNFWLPFVLFSLAIFTLVLYTAKDIRSRIGGIIGFFFICILYGSSAVITLNTILDFSRPTIYELSVIKKRISEGRHDTYYLELPPWGPKAKREEFSVAKSVYQTYEVGDNVEVVVRPGIFEIPWYYIQ